MQLAEVGRAVFLCCPPETGECALSRGNSSPRIFLVSQHDAADQLPVGRLDDVHDLAAMGFNECSIDVVRRDRFNLLALHDCFHRVFSLCENLSQNEVTATRVRELYVNNASVVPGQSPATALNHCIAGTY